ncbi:MAG: hypothetical protein RMJ07_06010 [Nitrososphaerota archaeon]|nr:hypothetical protein [Candidatus Bathyarchaeota archaeon]MDW8049213.1 hypothetical protein [Nitrososphaerota archaeon]
MRKQGGGSASLAFTVIMMFLMVFQNQVNTLLCEGEYSPESLFLTVYADGTVRVNYTVTVDPLLPNVNVTLVGSPYRDLIIKNEIDELLKYQINDGNKVLVYSLGSLSIRMTYTTPDLTSKVGRIWVLRVDSPINFTVEMPNDFTIISLSSIPEAIWTVGDYFYLTMASGSQEISYIVGSVASVARAQALISEAEETIRSAKGQGADTSRAEETLNNAKIAFAEGRYAEAELLAVQAKDLAEAALRSIPSKIDFLLIVAALILIAFVAAIFLSFHRRRGGRPIESARKPLQRIDVNKILEGKPHLRLEDREAIEFIASAGGEVFESELREHFNMPKSTTWRMVNRLKKEGLVRVEKIGGQNRIRLITKK